MNEIIIVVLVVLLFDFWGSGAALKSIWFYLNDRKRKKYSISTADFTEKPEKEGYRVFFKYRLDGQKIEGSFMHLFDAKEYEKIKSMEFVDVHIWQKDSKWEACTIDFSRQYIKQAWTSMGIRVGIAILVVVVITIVSTLLK